MKPLLPKKIEAIISRSVYNTGMKDFYDIYILLETINLVNMKESNYLKELWKKYNLTAPYSNRISFKEIFEPLYFIVKH